MCQRSNCRQKIDMTDYFAFSIFTDSLLSNVMLVKFDVFESTG